LPDAIEATRGELQQIESQRLADVQTRANTRDRLMVKIVTIHNFYKSCTNRLVKELFGEMLLVKQEGYGPDYPESFLPLDSSDFVATHHLLCLEAWGSLEPIAGLRHCVQSVCEPYHVISPLLALVEDAGQEPHISQLRRLIREHRESGRELISSGGFTIKKAKRTDRALSTLLKELVVALMCDDHWKHGNATLIGGGVIRFKTEQLWERSGYKPLLSPEGPLQSRRARSESDPRLS